MAAEEYKGRILPALSEDYDREYIVKREGTDFDMLHYSGYRMWLRPGYCSRGSTPEKCFTRDLLRLNPHTKEAHNSARRENLPSAITFSEYLKLFD